MVSAVPPTMPGIEFLLPVVPYLEKGVDTVDKLSALPIQDFRRTGDFDGEGQYLKRTLQAWVMPTSSIENYVVGIYTDRNRRGKQKDLYLCSAGLIRMRGHGGFRRRD